MRFIYYTGSLLGWAFLIYFCWQGSIPWWFKKGMGMMFQKGQETVKTIPTTDWAKPTEETKKEPGSETKTESNKTTESQKSDTAKNLFSGEINVGNLRSRYNLEIQSDKKTGEIGKQDMGAR